MAACFLVFTVTRAPGAAATARANDVRARNEPPGFPPADRRDGSPPFLLRPQSPEAQIQLYGPSANRIARRIRRRSLFRTARSQVCRNTRTGERLLLERSATDKNGNCTVGNDAHRLPPRTSRARPRRPCEAMTITSQLRALASFRIASAGNSLGTYTDVQVI